MLNKKSFPVDAKKLSLFLVFLLVEIPFYFIVFSDIENKLKLEFYSIFFAFTFSLFIFCIFKRNILILLGIFFTLLADSCLEILDKQYQIPALIFFIIAQTIYFVYLIQNEEKKKLFILSRCIFASVAAIAAIIVMKKNTDLKSVLAVIYICFLIHNVIVSVMHFKKRWLFSIGLILFLMCDICLGLSFLGDYVNSTNSVLKFLANINCWIFYLPSQVCIATCMLIDNEKPSSINV